MKRLLGWSMILLIISCSTKTPLDKNPGIQDIMLGENMNKYKERITFVDSMVTSKDALMVYIDLNEPISKNCEGGFSRVRTFTFKGRIMIIQMPSIYCPEINNMFIGKFGQPTFSNEIQLTWKGAKTTLIINKTGDHYDSGPVYNIEFSDSEIYSEYQKSIDGKI